MIISSFNINKFCGPYSNKGKYYNPRNLDFRTPIKEIVQSKLNNKDDLFFLQEFVNNKYININELFPNDKYTIYGEQKTKSNVVAITLNDSNWNIIPIEESIHKNKIIKMKNTEKNLQIISFQNTNNDIKKSVNTYFNDSEIDIIIGDFNDFSWVADLNKNTSFRDLVTNDMITFKPAQTAIDRIFVRNKNTFDNKIVFNGVIETYISDHNLLSFCLNI